jgi:hypothetical protein
MARPLETRTPPALVALTTAGIIGAGAAGLTAVAADLSRPAGYAIHAALVAAISAAILARPIRAGRPLSWLALAVTTYAVGVLTFPVAGWLFGLIPPAGVSSTIEARDVLPMYAFTPVGFLMAAPFSPAVLATSFIATRVLRPAKGAWPLSDPDRRFRRRTLVATTIVGVLVVGGLGIMFFAANSIGY